MSEHEQETGNPQRSDVEGSDTGLDARARLKQLLHKRLNAPGIGAVSAELAALSLEIVPPFLYRYRNCMERTPSELRCELLAFSSPATFDDDREDAYVPLDVERVSKVCEAAVGPLFPWLSRLMDMSCEEVGRELGKALFGREMPDLFAGSANEGFEVVRRRLFLDCKEPAQRDAVRNAFSKMYNENAADFPVEARELECRDRMVSCYPIHPEVFDRLYEDWATLQGFQRTRGVLRLMAAVIHELWMDGDESPMIMSGSFPLDVPNVRDELTRNLDENWNGVVDSEIDGRNSLPYRNDQASNRYGALKASRTSRAPLCWVRRPTWVARPHGASSAHMSAWASCSRARTSPCSTTR